MIDIYVHGNHAYLWHLEQVSNLHQAILQNISLFYLWPRIDDKRGHLERRKMEKCHFFLWGELMIVIKTKPFWYISTQVYPGKLQVYLLHIFLALLTCLVPQTHIHKFPWKKCTFLLAGSNGLSFVISYWNFLKMQNQQTPARSFLKSMYLGRYLYPAVAENICLILIFPFFMFLQDYFNKCRPLVC